MAEALVAGSQTTYNQNANREDLGKVLYNLSPTETPVMTMAGKNTATATNHEWVTDGLAAAADNKNLEGATVEGSAATARGRLGNYTQIMDKYAVVTGTQEKVLKGGGVKSEMAIQLANRMKEIKRDGEFAIVGQANAKVAGSATVAREMAHLGSYLVTNNQLGATGANPTGDGTDVCTEGTTRVLTEAIFEGGLQAMFTNSGGNSSVNAVVAAREKGYISDFTASSSRYVTTNDKKLVASIDVYVGDFHTVRVIPDRFMKSSLLYIIDPEYLKISELRPIATTELAKTGDAERRHIVWEWTLEVCNEKAHCMIAALKAS